MISSTVFTTSFKQVVVVNQTQGNFVNGNTNILTETNSTRVFRFGIGWFLRARKFLTQCQYTPQSQVLPYHYQFPSLWTVAGILPVNVLLYGVRDASNVGHVFAWNITDLSITLARVHRLQSVTFPACPIVIRF